jgi:hypothetical protein
MPKAPLEDARVDTKTVLAALWASTTFCYIYGDYFELYVPGKLEAMLQGKMPPLGNVTEAVLLGTSAMLAVPCVMVCLSLLLRPDVNRWLNIVTGVVYTAIMLLIAVRNVWWFYRFFAVVEIALTCAVVWHAWRWPRVADNASSGVT